MFLRVPEGIQVPLEIGVEEELLVARFELKIYLVWLMLLSKILVIHRLMSLTILDTRVVYLSKKHDDKKTSNWLWFECKKRIAT